MNLDLANAVSVQIGFIHPNSYQESVAVSVEWPSKMTPEISARLGDGDRRDAHTDSRLASLA